MTSPVKAVPGVKTPPVTTPAATASAASAPAAEAAVPEPATVPVDKPMRAVVYRKFRLPEFTFGYDQSSLSDEGKLAISRIVNELRKEKKWLLVRVDGHTDSIGSEDYNDQLSIKRAIAAATSMVLQDGFDPARIFVKGFGERQPIGANDTPEGRAGNRRIELLVLEPKE
jgi:outer membrane protein OmpA-like peptidoglycan-associated protein